LPSGRMMFTVMVTLPPGSRFPLQVRVWLAGLYATVPGVITGVPKISPGSRSTNVTVAAVADRFSIIIVQVKPS